MPVFKFVKSPALGFWFHSSFGHWVHPYTLGYMGKIFCLYFIQMQLYTFTKDVNCAFYTYIICTGVKHVPVQLSPTFCILCNLFCVFFFAAQIGHMVQQTTLYTVKGNAIISIFSESDLYTQCKLDPCLAVDYQHFGEFVIFSSKCY